MPTTTKTQQSEWRRPSTGTVTCEFDQIQTPGLYVEHRTGALMRVPEDALIPGRSPAIEIITSHPNIVTKISDDPFLGVTKARMIAADLDLHVEF